jgi:DNA-binding response OmpR family regulator
VELHGGSIRAESPGLGQGSTITITLPIDGGIAQRTVAVLEDDPQMREMLEVALKEAGHRTLAAGTAAESAPLLAQRPHLLVLDLLLPDGSGQEILKALRADPATRDLPVLMISGIPDVTEAELRAAGADEFLTKPFSHTVLVDTVARLLGRPQGGAAGRDRPFPGGTEGTQEGAPDENSYRR